MALPLPCHSCFGHPYLVSYDCYINEIKYLNLLLNSVRHVRSWRVREDYDNMVANDPDRCLFDSPYEDDRNRVLLDDLDEYPLVDDSGREIPLYNRDGFPVQRRFGQYRMNEDPLGLLVDSQRVHELFMRASGEDNHRPTKFHFFPQACLVTAGHIQANGVVVPSVGLLRHLNRQLRRTTTEDDEDDEDGSDNENWVATGPGCVKGLGSQLYNAVMHNSHGYGTQHHDILTGKVTASLGGAWTIRPGDQTKAKTYQRQCGIMLPHESYEVKVTDRQVNRELRIELVYRINLRRMRLRDRTGL